jgi:hypothetical protein
MNLSQRSIKRSIPIHMTGAPSLLVKSLHTHKLQIVKVCPIAGLGVGIYPDMYRTTPHLDFGGAHLFPLVGQGISSNVGYHGPFSMIVTGHLQG